MRYECTHFYLHELVSRDFFDTHGQKGWLAFDDRLLATADALRDRYGPMVINNWAFGGPFQWRGLRQPGSPHYSPLSQHSFGRALDCHYPGKATEEVRQDLIKNIHLFPHIRGIEMDVGWLHVDVRNSQELVLFRP